MSDALIVCSHLPGEGHFRSQRFSVKPVVCRDDWDYWAGLADAWQSNQTVLNLEHDLEVTDDHVAALLDCPHRACSWAYRCHWVTTGLPRDVIAAGTGTHFSAKQRYLDGGEEWADWSAIGLVKIRPDARTGPLRREPWHRLELAVHDAVLTPWHMHWPEIPHHHW